MKPTRNSGRKVFIATTYFDKDNMTRCPHCGRAFPMEFMDGIGFTTGRRTQEAEDVRGALSFKTTFYYGFSYVVAGFTEGPVHNRIVQCPECERVVYTHQLFKTLHEVPPEAPFFDLTNVVLDKSANVC